MVSVRYPPEAPPTAAGAQEPVGKCGENPPILSNPLLMIGYRYFGPEVPDERRVLKKAFEKNNHKIVLRRLRRHLFSLVLRSMGYL